MPEQDPTAQNLPSRLFRFLAEVTALRMKKVRNVASYVSVFWFRDLPHEKEVWTDAWGEEHDEEPWLRVDKPKAPTLRPTPEICQGWYDTASLKDSTAEPTLFDQKGGNDLETTLEDELQDEDEPEHENQIVEPLRLTEFPDIVTAWEDYISKEWRPWQRKMQRIEPIQRCYRHLFKMHQEQERRGEQYELLVGVGSLLWINASDQRVCRPILTTRATLSLHPQTARIDLNVSEDSSGITLEHDMLEVDDLPPQAVQSSVEAKVARLSSIWDRAEVLDVLREWFHPLPSAADGQLRDELTFVDPPGAVPQMCFAPVLMLRKRPAHAILNALKKVEDALKRAERLPPLIRQICGEAPVGNQQRRTPAFTGLPDDVLFPLPANDEQAMIVHRLAQRDGVLVQGPPGTGKSHTIVNLVCHLLANGKRVLVTSQTPRALRVLQDKFPLTVQPLVVSLLDDKEDSRNSLKSSVQGILEALDDPERAPNKLAEKIAELTRQRSTEQSTIAQLRRRQREIREKDTIQHSVSETHYSGTAQQIALKVERNAKSFSWLTDEVNGHPVSLTDAEATELLELCERFNGRPDELASQNLPEIEDLPSESYFREAVVNAKTAGATAEAYSELVENGTVKRLTMQDESVLSEFDKLCRQWRRISNAFSPRDDWSAEALADVQAGNSAVWSALADATRTILDEIQSLSADAFDATVECEDGISNRRLRADAQDLQQYLNSGGSVTFWLFRHTVVRRTRYLWQRTRVDGRLCCDDATLSRLIDRLQVEIRLEQATREWPAGILSNSGTKRRCVAALKEQQDRLVRLLHLHDHGTRIVQLLSDSLIAPPPHLTEVVVRNIARLVAAAQSLLHRLASESELNRIVDEACSAANVLNPHPHVDTLREAAIVEDADRYAAALTQLSETSERHRLARRCIELLERLEPVAPVLVAKLSREGDLPSMRERLPHLNAAWQWKTTYEWLERFDKEQSIDVVIRQLKAAEDDLHRLTEQLVSARAWRACVAQLENRPKQQSAMNAWQQKVESIGRGTGKYAESHRRDARKYLYQCWDAVPAHVMPLHRVAEHFQFDKSETFDVVIIDEASQTGPEGLLLTYLAKQCIVVGDDEQISPESGFRSAAEVEALIEQWIPDMPYANTLLPGTSVFDQAGIRFQGRLTLREHFRCMPEIIRFSNDLCYLSTPLIPLRQYPATRLTPLMDRFVTDGYREGVSTRVINRPEAAAVVACVKECLNDPRYREKSFGVICLQGHAQAQLIEQLLLEQIGAEPFKNPRIRLLCGDPYSFQGDERDIIFLSMVASTEGDARNAALTHKRYRQRFNVAASRACDQMWLIRSIRQSDLNPNCMRRQLVEFMSSNPVQLAPGVEQESLRRKSQTADRSVERPPAPFDSWFEVDVFLSLVALGYRILPQFPIAGKRIDLVVEDAQGRVAVECDGDEWHGPDDYDKDALRQQMLERAGWRFIRIRSSTFYASRSSAIAWLDENLKTHSIRPWQPTDVDGGYDAVHYREVSGSECLAMLGDDVVDTADSDLADLSATFDEVDGEDFDVDDDGTEAESYVTDTAPNAQLESLIENQGSEAVVQPDTPSETPLTASNVTDGSPEKSIMTILLCLFQANKPLTAGQIRWRTYLSEEQWTNLERELLEQDLIQKIGTGKRARFALMAEADSEPPATTGHDRFESLDADTWFKIAHWARVNDRLDPWQRRLAYSLGVLRRQGTTPSERQTIQGKRILEAVQRSGFFEQG